MHVYAGTKFPIHKVWWLREASQIRQTFIPYPLSSNFGGNWTSFHSKEKKKIKNADARVWGDARGDQKPRDFLLALCIAWYYAVMCKLSYDHAKLVWGVQDSRYSAMPLDRNTSFHTDSGLSLQHIIEFKIKITTVLKRGPPKLQFNSKTLTTY